MARVSKQFADDFSLVTSRWVSRGEHTQGEIDQLRAALRVELSPGPGLPCPSINGVPVKGWLPRDQERRIEAYTKAFADWAAEIRRDEAHSARIRAEVEAWKERIAA